ncbi:MAG: hypothetical protein NXI31_01165 [bacterium]|nr:hypothetical protein [bacterium]
MSARPARSRRRRLLFVLIGFVVVLLGLELAVRTLAWATGFDRATRYDAVTGWRWRANVSRRGDGWSAATVGTTNSEGWRDDEHAFERVPGKRRLLALGDSFVFGSNVDQGRRFTELLEDDATEVVNLGVSAWGTDQQLLAFEHYGCVYRPDVVIWVVCLANDLDDIRTNRKAGWSKPYFELLPGADAAAATLTLVPPEASWLVDLRGASHLAELAFQVLERGRPSKTYAPGREHADPIPLFEVLARRLRRQVEASGARLLAVLESPWQASPSEPGALELAARQALARAAVARLDLVNEFTARPADWSTFWLPCRHWSERGHAVVAAAVRAELQRRGW